MAKSPSERKTPGRKPRIKARHMTSGERAECLALWAAGSITLKELAKKYGKSENTIYKLCKREGVEKGQNKAIQEEAAREAIKQQAITDAQKIAERANETKEDHYKMAVGLAKLIWNEIAEAKKDNKPISTKYGSIKTLKMAAEGLKTLRSERYTILGIRADEDDESKPMPELVIKELSQDDIKQLQRRAALEAADGLGIPDIDMGDGEILANEDLTEDEDDRVVEGEDSSD